MLFCILSCLALQAGPVPDTVADPAAIYLPILEHALTTKPARAGLRVVLSETKSDVRCAPHCGERTAEPSLHSEAVIQQLKSKGLIHATCRTRERVLGCPSHASDIFVALGEIRKPPETFRVKPVMESPGGGVPLGDAYNAIPASAAVPVDAVVDVMVFVPEPPRKHPNRPELDHIHPDIMGFRYYLRAEPDGTYRIVARMLSWII